MYQMNKKIKLSLVSLVLVSTIGLTGTFAWTSMSQRAINEAGMTKQPGGRVHDDYEGIKGLESTTEGDINKDIYAENYSNKPLYVRIKLTEFYEAGEGAGKYILEGSNHIMTPSPDNKAKVLPNSGLDSATLSDRTTWPAYLPNGQVYNGSSSELRQIIQWTLGDKNDDRKVYLPTFNQNNQNLSADVTGEGIDELTWKKNLYYDDPKKVLDGTHNQWQVGETYKGILIKNDGQTSTPIETPNVTHKAKETLKPQKGGYMTMTEWLMSGKVTGNFWVHDSDGWLYWANELAPYEATSLLLDKLHVRVPQEDFYYAINVVSDFSTREDLAHWNSKTLNADELLNRIKVAN